MTESKNLSIEVVDRLVKYGQTSQKKLDALYKKQLQNPSEKLGIQGQIRYHKYLWMHHAFYSKDYDESRRHAAIVGMCTDHKSDHADLVSGSFHVLKRPLFILLMSDWEYLYYRFKSWDIPYGMPSKSYPRVWGERCMLHYVLKEDYDTLKKDYEYASKLKGNINWHKRYAPYLAIMNRDKDALKNACLDLCTIQYHQEMKECVGFTQELYHTLPTAALKLAWILGMEVEVDSKYIPMELIPIKPLNQYEVPYFFLDGFNGDVPLEYIKAEKERNDLRLSRKYTSDQYWKDFETRNKNHLEDTSGQKHTIQYNNHAGDTILGEFTSKEIADKFLKVVFHHGFNLWKEIPKDWQWDRNLYKSRKEAFFVKTYREYGYRVIQDEQGGWEIHRSNL